jgi:hypothetical protein
MPSIDIERILSEVTLEELGSNLGWKRGYTDFFVFFFSPPEKLCDNSIRPWPLLSRSFLLHHPFHLQILYGLDTESLV